MTKDAADIGPVQYLIVVFPGSRFRGEIAPAVADLVEAGTIRIIDLAFVTKDADGATAFGELDGVDPDVRKGLARLDVEVSGMLSEDDLRGAAEALEPGSSAALLVWEDVWAKRVLETMRDAGAVVVASDRIEHEVVVAAREYALSAA
jgi:hypothetical protein